MRVYVCAFMRHLADIVCGRIGPPPKWRASAGTGSLQEGVNANVNVNASADVNVGAGPPDQAL